MAPEDPSYAKFVRDGKDVHMIRTAAGVFLHPDLVPAKKFIVSEDGHALGAGTNWYDYECLSPQEFMPAPEGGPRLIVDIEMPNRTWGRVDE